MNTTILSRKHFSIGYALFMAYLGIEHCHNADMRRGWWAALDAEAECATPGYANRQGW